MKHGVHPHFHSFSDHPHLIQLSDTKGREKLIDAARSQIQDRPLFNSPISIPPKSADEVLHLVLEKAGCSHTRDDVDQRIINSVREK